MRFESRLAERVASGKAPRSLRSYYASLASIAFVVLTLTMVGSAVPQAVIHVGTNDSVALFVGQFEGKSDVVLASVSSVDDWICIKVPFKGKISDLGSIAFSEYIAQAGGTENEPFVVVKLPEGKSLICRLEGSNAAGGLSFQTLTWQSRDVVAQGKWVVAPVKTESFVAPLAMWPMIIGDKSVVSVSIYVGGWDISEKYSCYLSGFSINGVSMDLANMARKAGTSQEWPIQP